MRNQAVTCSQGREAIITAKKLGDKTRGQTGSFPLRFGLLGEVALHFAPLEAPFETQGKQGKRCKRVTRGWQDSREDGDVKSPLQEAAHRIQKEEPARRRRYAGGS